MQGRVRTKTVKRAARVLVEKYYQKLTLDFDTNKRICEDVADIQTKRLRNKIAGFTTVLFPLSAPFQKCLSLWQTDTIHVQTSLSDDHL